MENRYEVLSSRELKEMISAGVTTAILPIGSTEQHGEHAPVGTDALVAHNIGLEIAKKLDALCLPCLWVGVSSRHMDFCGTITLKPETMTQVIYQAMESLLSHGIKNILILNGHQGNTPCIDIARANICEKYPESFVATSSLWLALEEIYPTLPYELHADNWRTMIAHGGLLETSMVMYWDESLIKLEHAKVLGVENHVQATDPALSVTLDMKDLSPTGSCGNPTQATPELGKMFVEKTVEIIAGKYLAAKESFCPKN